MSKICAVCNKKIGFFWQAQPQPEVYTHPGCEKTFLQGPERYGGKAIEDPVQDELFIFDSKEMEKLASYDAPIEQLRKEKEKLKEKLKKKLKKKIKQQNEAEQLRKENLRKLKEKQRIKTTTKELKKIANSKINSLEPVTLEELKKQYPSVLPIANSKINSLEPVTLEELKKQDLSVLPEDIIHIMTLLAFSRTAWGDLATEDVAEFFDEKGNFLGDSYDPFSCLYIWLEYITRYEDGDTLDNLGRKKYLNQELDGLALYNFQVEILLIMLDVIGGEMANKDDFPDFPPERRSDRQRMLKITQLVYSSEFKKLLQSTTEFIDDKNGPHIDATNENGILTIKLNHKLRVYAGDHNDREETILNFINGGLLLQAFGKFTYKTPKHLHIFLEHNPTLFNKPARITTSMRWDDRRTWPKTKKYGKSFRETSKEYADRHVDLAYAWNDGLFGPFSYKCHKNFTTFRWKYPDFFKLDSIADIQNDHEYIFEELLDAYEGKRYPQVPFDTQLNSHEL